MRLSNAGPAVINARIEGSTSMFKIAERTCFIDLVPTLNAEEPR